MLKAQVQRVDIMHKQMKMFRKEMGTISKNRAEMVEMKNVSEHYSDRLKDLTWLKKERIIEPDERSI